MGAEGSYPAAPATSAAFSLASLTEALVAPTSTPQPSPLNSVNHSCRSSELGKLNAYCPQTSVSGQR